MLPQLEVGEQTTTWRGPRTQKLKREGWAVSLMIANPKNSSFGLKASQLHHGSQWAPLNSNLLFSTWNWTV